MELSKMFSLYEEFQHLINDDILKMTNYLFMKTIKKFTFCWITDDNNIDKKITQIKNHSHIIILDKFEDKCKEHLIICFDYILLIFLSDNLSLLSNFFEQNHDSTIFSLSNDATEILINKFNYFRIPKIDPYFIYQINLFLKRFQVSYKNSHIFPFWKLINKCISGFLIKKSYQNNQIDRFIQCKETLEKEVKNEQINENSYVVLNEIAMGSQSTIKLVYHIEKEELFALKMFDLFHENPKYFEREKNNYLKFHHPLLPKYLGSNTNQSGLYLFVEYIEGHLLKNINELNCQINEKMKFIFEIMIIINYFHQNNHIYRDLKPNNFIINKSKTLILIDFDRLIENNKKFTNGQSSIMLSQFFLAPEISLGKEFSFEADIYPLGVLIYYIFFEKIPPKKNINDYFEYDFDEFPEEYSELKKMCQQCTQFDSLKRPKISELIDSFYFNFFSRVNKQLQETTTIQLTTNIHTKEFFPYWIYIAENNNPNCIYELGLLYENDELFPRDIEKAIHYFNIASNQNLREAQFHLGSIYLKEEYVPKNIDKAIYYYTLAADQNDRKAQFNLAMIYIKGENGTENCKKGIHYLKILSDLNCDQDAKFCLASCYFEGIGVEQNIEIAMNYYLELADQRFSNALFTLGILYIEGKFIKKDINKGLNYLQKASEQNNPDAQFNLGIIYYNGEFLQKDILKGIKYLESAAEENHLDSQLVLGKIFCTDEEIKDISKGIQYLTAAAIQNNSIKAQIILGNLFIEGKIVNADINQAIYFYSHAAIQNNNLDAQIYLGYLFYEGKSEYRNINQAIYYFTLASDHNNSAEAQFNLGIIYKNGKYITANIKKSIHFFTLAANNNDPQSQYNLGLIYYNGIYVSKDVNKAMKLFYEAAAKGHAMAQYNLGYIYYEGTYVKKDISKAIDLLKLSAAKNYVKAQLLLGKIFLNEIKNINNSIYYFTLAANNKNKIGQYYLGMIFYENKYILRDIPKAINYLTLSADQKNKESQFLLGLIYYKGQYVSQNIKKSMHYLLLASNNNSSSANYMLGLIYYEGIYVQRNINKSFYYLSISSKYNEAYAQNMLGDIYREDIYIKKDLDKSIYYYTQAANQNFEKAQYNLGSLYLLESSKKDIKKSIYFYTLAAKKLHDAQYILAMIYFEGKYVKRDMNKAIHYYKELSSMNNQYAKNNLGIIYYHGIGIEKNIFYAIELFQESINKKDDPISMFNLANILINNTEIKIDKFDPFKLLINSSMKNFQDSKILLSLLFIKKYQFPTLKDIENELKSHNIINNELKKEIYGIITDKKLDCSNIFNLWSKLYQNCYYVYDKDINVVFLDDFLYIEDNKEENPRITKDFYDGFGIQI